MNSSVKKRKTVTTEIQTDNDTTNNQFDDQEVFLLENLTSTINTLTTDAEGTLGKQILALKSFKSFDKLLNRFSVKKRKLSLWQRILVNWDILLLCLINIGLIFFLVFFVASYLSPESDYNAQFYDLNTQAYRYITDKLIGLEVDQEDIRNEPCALKIPSFAMPLLKPIDDCKMCDGLKKIERLENISREEFLEYYAYTGVPVIITDAMKNWSCMTEITFQFLKDLYSKSDEIAYQKRQAKLANTNNIKLKSIISTFKSIVETDEQRRQQKDTCQFFPYKTNFRNLREVFDLETDSLGQYEKPWYVGWSNCNGYAGEVLRQHYERPYFLPLESEMSRLDWIFMGTPEYGAAMHIDEVNNPSWQAQISGIKLWTFKPPAECLMTRRCETLQVEVFPGDVIVFDSNRWFHSTFIKGEEISLTIGSEYD